MTQKLCLTSECDKEALTRGLCSYHYEKARYHGHLEEIALPKRVTALKRHGDRVLELWESGMSMIKIAQELGLSHPTIRHILEELGIQNPGRHSPRARMLKLSREQADWIGQLDHLPALEAVLHAWNAPEQDAEITQAAQNEIHQAMPLLGRALVRLSTSKRQRAWFSLNKLKCNRAIWTMYLSTKILHAVPVDSCQQIREFF